MRRLISLLILLVTFNSAFAEEVKFKDLPENHWAESAVYKLVKAGITSGYPDGTFRGMKKMTRGEMAGFLSNLARNGKDYSDVEKILAELKTEFAGLEYEKENPSSPALSGGFFGRVIEGPKFDYRLQLSLFEKSSQAASIKATLDTLDAGYGGGTRDLATKMFNAEARIKYNGINYKAIIGPGNVLHRETSGVNYSDDNLVFAKPRTGVGAQAYFQSLDLSLDYEARNVSPLGGLVGVNEVTGRAAYTHKSLFLLGKTTFSLRPRCLWDANGRDLLCEFGSNSFILPFLSADFLLGAGNTASLSGLYAKAAIKFERPSTALRLVVHKVGESYRKAAMDKYEFIDLNSFNKFVLDGSVDTALELAHKTNNCFSVRAKADAVLTPAGKIGKEYRGTSLTTELGINMRLSDRATLYSFYRAYCVPSGFSSTDPALNSAVPTLSDIFGLEVSLGI